MNFGFGLGLPSFPVLGTGGGSPQPPAGTDFLSWTDDSNTEQALTWTDDAGVEQTLVWSI